VSERPWAEEGIPYGKPYKTNRKRQENAEEIKKVRRISPEGQGEFKRRLDHRLPG